MLYTNLLYHSRFDTQIFKMPIAFIYTFVCLYTYRLLWDHALQLPCWKFAAPLCLMMLLRHLACRRRPRLHVRLHPATDNEDASTKARSSNIMYIWITVHTWTFIYMSVILTSCFTPICLTESMLLIYSLHITTILNVWCFPLRNTVVEMIYLLETTTQKIKLAACTYWVDMLLATTSATHAIS